MKRTTEQKKVYKANKLLMYERDKFRCRSCNSSEQLTPHHIILRSALGSDDLNNLLTLCLTCHNAVHSGHLLLEVIDSVVKFTRKQGWKP